MGGARAHASLLLTLSALDAHVVEDGSLTVPFVGTKLNANGDISDPGTVQALRSVLAALARAIEAH